MLCSRQLSGTVAKTGSERNINCAFKNLNTGSSATCLISLTHKNQLQNQSYGLQSNLFLKNVSYFHDVTAAFQKLKLNSSKMYESVLHMRIRLLC